MSWDSECMGRETRVTWAPPHWAHPPPVGNVYESHLLSFKSPNSHTIRRPFAMGFQRGSLLARYGTFPSPWEVEAIRGASKEPSGLYQKWPFTNQGPRTARMKPGPPLSLRVTTTPGWKLTLIAGSSPVGRGEVLVQCPLPAGSKAGSIRRRADPSCP